MLELGKTLKKNHYECGRFIAKSRTVDMLVLFGRHVSYLADGAVENGMKKSKVKMFSDKKKMTDFLNTILSKDDTVLVKGSRSMKIDEVVKDLTESYSVKSHPSTGSG
jgi:UDP-N-acetylmuramoyl-tripeptide--D-alanyl-D-alanine ligase